MSLYHFIRWFYYIQVKTMPRNSQLNVNPNFDSPNIPDCKQQFVSLSVLIINPFLDINGFSSTPYVYLHAIDIGEKNRNTPVCSQIPTQAKRS